MIQYLKSLDARTLFGWLYGFGLLASIDVLAAAIAMGKVHQESSFGLPTLLGCLITLTGQWAQWAFSQMPKKEDSQ